MFIWLAFLPAWCVREPLRWVRSAVAQRGLERAARDREARVGHDANEGTVEQRDALDGVAEAGHVEHVPEQHDRARRVEARRLEREPQRRLPDEVDERGGEVLGARLSATLAGDAREVRRRRLGGNRSDAAA